MEWARAVGRRTAKSATASYCWLLGIFRLAPFSSSLRSSAGTKLASKPIFVGAATNPNFWLSWLSERTPAYVLAHGLWEFEAGACASVFGGAPDSARRMPTLRPANVDASETTQRDGALTSARSSCGKLGPWPLF